MFRKPKVWVKFRSSQFQFKYSQKQIPRYSVVVTYKQKTNKNNKQKEQFHSI